MLCLHATERVISLHADDCLGMQLKSETIPNSQQVHRRMLQKMHKDGVTCHVDITCSVIWFEIRKHNSCRSSRLRPAVPCVVWADVEHFVSLHCFLSQVHAQLVRRKHQGSHPGKQIDSFVSRLVGGYPWSWKRGQWISSKLQTCPRYIFTTTKAFR